MMCDLSIIIVNWNTRDLLAGCLASVAGDQRSEVRGQQSEVRSHEFSQHSAAETSRSPISERRLLTFEVIVVDNASIDGSAAMVRERFPSVQLIENQENVGFARANNQAIYHSQGQYVLLLNSDTIVHPGALGVLVQFMDAHPQAGACGARLLNDDGSLQPSVHPMLTPGREFWRLSFLDRIWPHATYPMQLWDTATPQQVEVIKGACLLLRRTAIDQVGMLDNQYFMYNEEVDLCHRLGQAGWSLWYVPLAEVTHFGEASSKQVQEDMFLQLYRSKILFYRKFSGKRGARRFKALVAVAYVLRWSSAIVAAQLRPNWSTRARVFRRLLAELPRM